MALNRMPRDREIGWDVDWIGAHKEKAAWVWCRPGVALPIHQLNVDGGSTPHYMLGDFTRGEQEVELVCKMVRAAGIPAIKYFLCEMEEEEVPNRTRATSPSVQ